MANPAKYKWLSDASYPPGFVAHCLLQNAQGGDRDAAEAIARIMQADAGGKSPRATSVATELRAATGHAVVSGRIGAVLGSDPVIAVNMGPTLPRKILLAAMLICAAKAGSAKAQATIAKVIRAADNGNDVGKNSLAVLRAAMPIVSFYESALSSVGAAVGATNLYSMFKAFDPTRQENAGMRSILQIVPGGGAALTAVDAAAKINKAIGPAAAAAQAAKAAPKPAAPKPAPAPAPAQRQLPAPPPPPPAPAAIVVYRAPERSPWWAPASGAYRNGLRLQ